MAGRRIVTCIQTVRIENFLNKFQRPQIFTPSRNSSYRSSKPVGSPDLYTNVEISTSPEEWKYVERLLPSKFVPEPSTKSEYPSGWRPPTASLSSYPYFVERNRNHMLPLYLKIQGRGEIKTTKLKRIQGDIWALQDDLKCYVEKRSGKYISLQVQEVAGHINIKGDYVRIVEEWLQDKGF
ncbi:large ribosomal subunit protein mL49 [Periplaneta americana]|uniref:large ribosomal subunit protein mL49 n=1 Tax=Periplaneta americana TaxID=6978 RepID=UPI0037E83BEB